MFLCQICSFIIENSSGANQGQNEKRPGLRRVWSGGLGPGSTRWVDRVSPGQLPSGFLPPPGPVPCPGPGSARRAGPGFKTMSSLFYSFSFYTKFDLYCFDWYLFYFFNLRWLGILFCNFFKFAFYEVTRSHDSGHVLKRLAWFEFGLSSGSFFIFILI